MMKRHMPKMKGRSLFPAWGVMMVMLAVLLWITMLPAASQAEAVEIDLTSIIDGAGGDGYTFTGGILTLSGAGPFSITTNGVNVTDKRIRVQTSVSVKAMVGITLKDTVIDVSETEGACAFDMTGEMVELTLMGSNSLKSWDNSEDNPPPPFGLPGLQVPAGAELTITDGTGDGTGSLTATGSTFGAAIGSGYLATAGTIIINSGTVTANGGWNCAGIGGGSGGDGGTVIINGGTVTASGGGNSGAGIGGGAESDTGGTVIINGGTVTAMGNGGAGIGGGGYGGGSGGTVTIMGGTVSASSVMGAGIGGNVEGNGGDVYISGGSVKAESIYSEAIGKGEGGGNSGKLKNKPGAAGGVDVYRTALTLSGSSAATSAVTSLSTDAGYTYGINGMKTDENSLLYLYLPEGTNTTEVQTVSGSFNIGSVTTTTDPGTSQGVLSAGLCVTFESGDAGNLPIQNVPYNGLVSRPADPDMTGYTFGGWYKDEECSDPWDFDADTVTENITLYALWVEEVVSVASIGTTEYTTLSDALGAAQNGETIVLLKDIVYSSPITIDGKTITFALNGHTLNVEVASGNALTVQNGGKAEISGAGAFNLKTTAPSGYGVYVTGSGSSAHVSGVTAGGVSSYGAYAISGGRVTVEGNIEASAQSSKGVSAQNYAAVTVNGNITASGQSSTGALAYNTATDDNPANGITISGNVSTTGWGCFGLWPVMGGRITVGGDLLLSGSQGRGIRAEGGQAVVNGNVAVSGNGSLGLFASAGGLITIDGTVTGNTSVYIGPESVLTGRAPATTKFGYATYTDGTSTVWLKLPVYTVTFESDGGTYATVAVTEGERIGGGIGSASRPDDPTKAGYTFCGWYKDVGGTDPWDFDSDTVTENITLYALWLENVASLGNTQYTTLSAALAAVQSGETKTITLLKNIVHSSPIVIDEKTVTFALNGHALNVEVASGKALTVQNGGQAEISGTGAFNLKTTAPSHYGVYVTGSGSSAHVTSVTAEGEDSWGVYAENGGTVTVDGDVEVSGVDSAGAYAQGGVIVVHGNLTSSGLGGVGVEAEAGPLISQGAVVTVDGTISAAHYIRMEGVTKTQADMAAATTKAGYATYTDDANTVWVKTSFTITFRSDDIIYHIATAEAGTPIDSAQWPVSPEKTGYTFGGWYTGMDGAGAEFTAGATVNANGIVFAKWTANTYPITYNLDGGANSASNPSSYTYGSGFVLSIPNKTDYHFGGWYRDPQFTVPVSAVSDTQTGEIILYARWTINTYTINIGQLSGGTITTTPATASAGTNITLTVTPGTGKRLVANSLKYSHGGAAYPLTITTQSTASFTMPPADVIITAQFEAIPPSTYELRIAALSGGSITAGSSGNYPAGAVIHIAASPDSGYSFSRWTTSNGASGGNFANPYSASTTFTMPGNTVTITAEFSDVDDGTDTSPGGNTGGNPGDNPSSVTYVSDRNIHHENNQVTVDLTQGATTLSASQINELADANRTKPVILEGNGYSITFPAGVMSSAGANANAALGDLDLGVTFNEGENYAVIRSLSGADFLTMVDFSHSGALPGKAKITFNIGSRYAGRTLSYYYFNPQSGRLEFIQDAVTDEKGHVTVIQDHFSQYVFLLEEQRMPSDIPVRIYGQTRYDTAVAIAKIYFGSKTATGTSGEAGSGANSGPARGTNGGAETVVLVRGDVSADALPAVPLARYYNAPLLLTEPDNLPDAVLNEIKELGAKTVIIVGGPGAVQPVVEERLKAGLGSGIIIERIYGQSHYDTAYEVAKRLPGNSGTAVLVNGNDYEHTFPDALSISPWAGYHGAPILYVDSTLGRLPEATAKALRELKINRTILIGGTSVIPSRLEALVPNPERYGGTDLFHTNLFVLKNLQPNPTQVYVATGLDFADALAGAAVAARTNGWLLLTGAPLSGSGNQSGSNQTGSGQAVSALTVEQTELLKSVQAGSPGRALEFHVFGGSAVVPEATLEAVKALLGL